MKDRVGIAVLGCGYWGINYVRVFGELPQARVVTVCDQRPERLREIQERFPNVHCTTDIDEALSMDGVHAAVICTPATSHYEVALRCLTQNKHLLIEKPITTTVADADDLISRARERSLLLMVGHIFLYNPAIEKVKDFIMQGDVGKVYYLYARRTNMGPLRHDVNALWDLAPHDISIFNYLMASTPQWVSAVGARVLGNSREDVGFISLGYAPDVVCHVHVSWADAYRVREVVVVGSERRIVFNDFHPIERVRVFDKGISLVEPEASSFGASQFQMRDGEVSSPYVEVGEPLKTQCSHFLDCVMTGKSPRTSALAGRDVVNVMAAIDRSVKNHGTPIMVGEEMSDVYADSYATARALR